MRIAVDIDDTLNAVDRVRYAGEYIRRKNLPFRLVDENAHMLEKVYDWSHDDVLEFVHDGGITAFTDAPARKGAKEVLERWRAAGIEVIVLTSRVAEWFGNPEKVSRDWLEKRHIPYDGLVASCADKGAYCAQNNIDILIDDSVEQCLSAQESKVAVWLIPTNEELMIARDAYQFVTEKA